MIAACQCRQYSLGIDVESYRLDEFPRYTLHSKWFVIPCSFPFLRFFLLFFLSCYCSYGQFSWVLAICVSFHGKCFAVLFWGAYTQVWSVLRFLPLRWIANYRLSEVEKHCGFEKYRNTAVWTWIKHWSPCGGRSMNSYWCMHKATDLPLVRYDEMLDHKYRRGTIAANHQADGDESFATSP